MYASRCQSELLNIGTAASSVSLFKYGFNVEANKHTSPEPHILKALLQQQHPGVTYGNNTGLCTKLLRDYTRAHFKKPPQGG